MERKRRHARRTMQRDIDEILKRVDALPIVDERPEDEILGYDQYGIRH